MGRALTFRTAGLVVAAAFGLSLVGFSSVAQALGGFSVRPGRSNPADPVTRAYFKPTLRAGGSTVQSVIVANSGSTSVALRVYPVDGLTGQTTGTVYANRRDPVRKAGRWVTLGVSRITVPAGQQLSVPFVVRVPRSATAGDHVAGIAFEVATPKTSPGRFRIKEVIREVIGVQVRVPGRAAPQITLGAVKLMALPGTPVASVVVDLGNRGLKLCKPTLAVSLRGPHGYRHSVKRALDTVLPGDTVAYPLPWPGMLHGGKYAASTSAGCDGQHVARLASMRLGKTLGVAQGTRPGASSGSGGIPTWAVILIALAGLGVGVAATQLHTAKRHRTALVEAERRAPSATPDAESHSASS
jgi:hypothetical protein